MGAPDEIPLGLDEKADRNFFEVLPNPSEIPLDLKKVESHDPLGLIEQENLASVDADQDTKEFPIKNEPVDSEGITDVLDQYSLETEVAALPLVDLSMMKDVELKPFSSFPRHRNPEKVSTGRDFLVMKLVWSQLMPNFRSKILELIDSLENTDHYHRALKYSREKVFAHIDTYFESVEGSRVGKVVYQMRESLRDFLKRCLIADAEKKDKLMDVLKELTEIIPTDDLFVKDSIEHIGKGAFGDVYRGVFKANEDIGSDESMLVTMKLVRPATASALRRFQNEVENLNQVRNLKRIMSLDGATRLLKGISDIPKSAGAYMIISEYIEGVSLKEALDEREGHIWSKERVNWALDVFLGILDSLSEIHERGVYHRDIKPANVIVTGKDRVEVRLVDFGLSKKTQKTDDKLNASTFLGSIGNANKTNGRIGTPSYMSPENITDKSPHEFQASSDQWAAVLVFLECCTGTRVFGDEDPVSLIQMQSQMAEGDELMPLYLRKIFPDLQYLDTCRPLLTALIDMVFSADPEKRISSTSETARIVRALRVLFAGKGEMTQYLYDYAQAKVLRTKNFAEDSSPDRSKKVRRFLFGDKNFEDEKMMILSSSSLNTIQDFADRLDELVKIC